MRKVIVEQKILEEPNVVMFKSHGLLCCILRVSWSGHLCGYVAVPKSHKLYGIDCDNYDKVNIHAHGGITYSSNHLGHISKDVFEDLWWFGFDTAHCNDIQPIQMEEHIINFPDSKYRDIDYVKKETIELSKQLSEIK